MKRLLMCCSMHVPCGMLHMAITVPRKPRPDDDDEGTGARYIGVDFVAAR